MPEKPIADAHHVARHCNFAKDFSGDPEYVALHGSAFEPTAENPNVSVNWREYFTGYGIADGRECLEMVRTDLVSVRTVSKSHRLAIIEVGRAKAIARGHRVVVEVLHKPERKNDSHSELLGIPLQAKLLQQDLADEAFKNIVPAVLQSP